jgi:hypothetical protein
MINTRAVGRIGILAAGLSIGAALAAMPGTATADPASDWWSSIDGLLSGASPAVTPEPNLAISFDGYSLIHEGSALANTEAGQYGLAIAYGSNALANAEGGNGDFAFADGANAYANAGSLTAGATGNDYDTAVDIGNNIGGGANQGAFAGSGSLSGYTDVGTSSHDTAYDIGNNGGFNDGAFAGSDNDGPGNGDTAYDFGNNSGSNDATIAADGNNNYASDSGNNTGSYEGSQAEAGNFNSTIVDTNYSTDAYTFSGNGNDNYAYVYGPDNSNAFAEDGNGNIAYIDDPYGAAGAPDSALAGYSGNYDLAEVLFTHGDADASGGNLLYDIISLFGTEATPAAATTGGGFLTDLLGLL